MAYHIFLSFRGEDTRNTFTDHLYTALSGAGFRTFRDDAIERGKDVKSELAKAIKEAKSSIVVLSKGYASSGWCLDELMMILERKRSSSGAKHVVLPIFYDVDPSQVRKQSGSFDEAFCRHEERLNAETNAREKECLREKVQAWRQALTEVADLAGMVLQNQADRHESRFIQQILREIGKSVSRPVVHVAHYQVGIESRAESINSWLQDESNSGIGVIYGMGGVGKTTIAKFAYNLNVERYEASSFLADIREYSGGPMGPKAKGLVRFQKQLFSDILKTEREKVWSVDEGISKIKDVIRCKRVLVVLDDLDHRDQLEALIGMRDWLHPGSKVIVTTRNIHLLKANEIDVKFEVWGLEFPESLELFCWHAFGQGHPIEGYNEISKSIAQHCEGLPLALQVLGVLVHDSDLDIWRSALERLADIPNLDIQKKLEISYDYLNDYEKELFLHIACFFIGKSKDFIVRILGDLHPTVGIKTLSDRCLLTIDGDKLKMHQLLQQMAIEIVRRDSSDPGKRSRLCHHKDSFQVLRTKCGTESIKGLLLDMHRVLKEDHMELTTDAFSRMCNLKLLLLYNVEIKGRYIDFPRGLKYLSWHGFPLTSIPIALSLNRLVDLDLRYSKLEQAWKGKMVLASLKILNLSHSYALKSTPNLVGLTNLEKLVLKDCIRLVEVHESIVELKGLVSLNLRGCKKLKKLPCEIGRLTSLEKLVLSDCSKLDQLPGKLEQMKSLTVLRADGISQDIGNYGSWTSIIWSFVLKPRKSPKILPSLPGSLVELSLSNNSLSSDDLANCLGSLYSLIKLDLSMNPISSLPENIKGLTLLKSLVLNDCPQLKSLPELPMSLEGLKLHSCSSLETITNLPKRSLFHWIDLSGVIAVEVPGWFKLEPVINADAEIINELGLSSELKTIGSLEMRLANYYSGKDNNHNLGPVKLLHECGTYNIWLPGSTVPASWFSSKKRIGSRISFTVPSFPILKIKALKIYVVLTRFIDDNDSYKSTDYDYITVHNMTKGLKWAYSPYLTFVATEDDDPWVWLSYWRIGNHLTLEVGDEVKVFAGSANWDWMPVQEIGVRLEYEVEEKGDSQHQKAYSHQENITNVGDLSAYELRPGYYHLCNDSYHDVYRPDDYMEQEKIIFGELEDSDGELEDYSELEDSDGELEDSDSELED